MQFIFWLYFQVFFGTKISIFLSKICFLFGTPCKLFAFSSNMGNVSVDVICLYGLLFYERTHHHGLGYIYKYISICLYTSFSAWHKTRIEFSFLCDVHMVRQKCNIHQCNVLYIVRCALFCGHHPIIFCVKI